MNTANMHASKANKQSSLVPVASTGRVSRDTPRSFQAAPVAEEYDLCETYTLQPPKSVCQSTTDGSVQDDAFEKKEKKEVSRLMPIVKMGTLLSSTLSARMRGSKGMHYKTALNYGFDVTSNSAASKYLPFLTGSTPSVAPNSVQNAGEWSSFNSVFEEFFIHRMTLIYKPNNKNLPGYVNSTSTNVQSSSMSIAAYQHDQGAVVDASSAVYQLLNSSQSAVVHTGEDWKFSWRNNEKFDLNGTVGDATTASHTQAWLNMADIAKYGGAVFAALPFATNATPSNVAYGQSVTFGTIIVKYIVSFRYRD